MQSPSCAAFSYASIARCAYPTAFDAHGVVVPNVAFTWSSSDSLLASVGATGLVTALDEGTVVIAAAADSVKGVASVRVTQVAAGVEVTPRVDTLHTVGRTVQFIAIAFARRRRSPSALLRSTGGYRGEK